MKVMSPTKVIGGGCDGDGHLKDGAAAEDEEVRVNYGGHFGFRQTKHDLSDKVLCFWIKALVSILGRRVAHI